MSVTLKPLDQQVVVITGASSGIGLAAARSFAKEGAKVVVTARSSQVLDDLVSEIETAGGQALAYVAEISSRAEVEKVASAAIEKFGRIDTWVNDAGLGIFGKLEEVSEEDNRRLFDVNFWGVVNGSLAALPYLKRQGGALINLGSEVSEAVLPLQGMYSTTKHAVKGFTDALRVELEVDKIPVSVTLIQPTAVNTPYPQHAANYMDQEPKLPEPMIDPQQVADAIVKAAVEGGNHIKVGAVSKIDTIVSSIFPALADKMSGAQADRQHYDEPPRNPAGALYSPTDDGQTHGSGGVKK
jgi:short-subunit dehydrogenase